jgi:hypothetical protein
MRNRTKKCTAWLFLIVFGIETFIPGMAYALTSGPAQPELTKFEPAGVNDMVDLFTGDFKYNIPLVDVGGYPINLSYHSGDGMEEEASWVGFGWTLNPGSINRDLRGLPDDFTGKKNGNNDYPDAVTKTYNRKMFAKIGGEVVVKPTALAWEIGASKGNASFNLGIYKDNYYGVGASVGFSLSNRRALNENTSLTAGLDFTSDNREGANFSPSLSLSRTAEWKQFEFTGSVTGSFAYNTRAGLKQVELGASFSTTNKENDAGFELRNTAVKYFGQTYTPTFNTNTFNDGITFSFDLGPTLFGGYVGIGGSGYYYQESIVQKKVNAPAFGYMNYLDGRKSTNALIDFNREKEGVYVPGTPAIPIPVPTNDFFTATGQAGSLQFRPYFNGNYVVFDKAYFNNSTSQKAGVTLGFGNVQKSGGRIDETTGSANTGKWVSNNDFLVPGEPAFNVGNNAAEEAVNFKQTGEMTRANDGYLTKIKNEKTVQVVINDKGHFSSNASTWQSFKSRDGLEPLVGTALKKDVRDKRTSVISFLNADQATHFGLDKTINGEDRVNVYRKAHHLSEITVTDNAGKRMVYGIPVYNKKQYEVSFSINKPEKSTQDEPFKEERALKTGLIKYNVGKDNSIINDQGRDQMYSKEEMPPYATSFLLTGILSPDYVDVGNDGISDDDLGTAYKFNYTRVHDDFGWRAPYAAGYANYNQGFISDPKDDKASYVYGNKELWYLSSVESKTMIAFFETSDREDGLGVVVDDENGGKETTKRLKKLDRITLYSKADWLKDSQHAVPIKVVHFEYDYTTHPGVPNNTGNVVTKDGSPVDNAHPNLNAAKGKLTLKRIYFTFGKNTRGQSNPYDFSYEQRTVADVLGTGFPTPPNSPQDPVSASSTINPEATNSYANQQSDRWGTYKPSWYNHLTGNGNSNGMLTNSEFPYAIQEDDDATYDERKLAGLLASMWQLNKITTPTGSTVSIEYEADDYGYVQNRRAMQMCFVKSLGNNVGTPTGAGMMGSDGFTVELPVSVSDVNEFKSKYLTGADGQMLSNVYYKIYTDLDDNSHYEYVQGYAEIDPVACQLIGNKAAFIAFKKIDGYNPVTRAAWQTLKTDLPQYAYDNYDNSDVSFTTGAIKSLIQSFANMREYFQSYERTAYNRNYADNIDLSRSMIRLCNPNKNKIGGGARVRRLTIEDDWYDMSHTKGKTAKYGQLYDYTIKDANGQFMSTGVAAYEPQIGNEENPFHEPIPYTEKVHWAPDKYHFVERPFCESFFPAASVGYSKVTVTSFGDDEAQSDNLAKYAGYTENEFYTARDFPSIVDNLPLEPTEYENGLIVKLFTSTTIKRVAASQGFKVELNDMHGKPRSVKVFDKGGAEIASTETFYNVDDENAREKHLNNTVDVIQNGDGKIVPALMATDVDLATDVRESKNESEGVSLGVYEGGMMIPPFYWPYFAVNPGYSITKESFHSVSTVKVIHKYGIVKKTITRQNGSTIEAENVLWDGETGAVLLTKTQNEFNDYTYAFTYPAYWAEGHEGMGAAYQNIGAVLTNLDTQSGGLIPSSYYSVVFPGDELINNVTEQKSWVMKAGNDLRLIDAAGNMVAGVGTYIVYRSGKRNLTGASAGSIVCMKNPIVETGGTRKLQFNVGNKILDAKAVLYSNEWSMPVGERIEPIPANTGPWGASNIFYIENRTGAQCYSDFRAYKDQLAIAQRSFMNFPGIGSSIPANATIVSAQLTLYPLATEMIGDNPSVLRRVTEVVDCGSGKTWTNLPAVTSTNEVTIPALSSTVTSPQVFDVSAMFRDWFTIKDAAEFGIGLQLVYEDGSSTKRSMSFSQSSHLSPGPQLVVYYQTDGCVSPLNYPLNPYVQGILGNWRPKQNLVYMVDREQKPGSSTQPGGTDIRNNGAYTIFNPFWEFTSAGQLHTNVQVEPILPAERWVWASKSIYYDQKGNEIESASPVNRNAQGEIDVSGSYRYSSALYGYGESAAIAVATNARHNEIAFDGFEDYYFTLNNTHQDACAAKRHFDWGLTGGYVGNSHLANDTAHTGKYSLYVNGDLYVSKPQGSASPQGSILSYNSNGQAILMENELSQGFSPIGSGKQYLLSMWVYDGVGDKNTINGLSVDINSVAVDMSKPVPVVEGWKQLVVPFTAGSQFDLHLHGNSTYIDDVRIFPYESNMTTYVYDDRTMRLMAQLDENNFATFYEYDDEGTPIRVKKETERGIMTLKENRQSFKTRP